MISVVAGSRDNIRRSGGGEESSKTQSEEEEGTWGEAAIVSMGQKGQINVWRREDRAEGKKKIKGGQDRVRVSG